MRISDWSSDVCSSDLPEYDLAEQRTARQVRPPDQDREHSSQTLSDDGRCKGEDERVYGYFPEVLASQQIGRSEEHTSELQSLMRISYDVFCLKKKKSISCRSLSNSNTTTMSPRCTLV